MAVARLPSGEAFAVPDHCPHAGVPLSEGFVEDGQLVCPMHGWAFELPSGRCVARPEIVIDVTRLNKPRSRPAAPLGQQSLDLSHESAHESARESAHESAHESARES